MFLKGSAIWMLVPQLVGEVTEWTFRSIALLEEACHWGGLWEFIASSYFKFTLSALCLQFRCDLSDLLTGCRAFFVLINSHSGTVSQNEHFYKLLWVMAFYHSNSQLANTQLQDSLNTHGDEWAAEGLPCPEVPAIRAMVKKSQK